MGITYSYSFVNWVYKSQLKLYIVISYTVFSLFSKHVKVTEMFFFRFHLDVSSKRDNGDDNNKLWPQFLF